MTNKQEFLKKIKNEKNILIYKDYFFKELNTFKINYLIETLIIPKSVYALKKVINYAIEYEIPYVIVGNGSKILFQTHYVKKVVILLKDQLSTISYDGRNVYAQAGATLAQIIIYAQQFQLGGMESLIGIPATLGGAIYKNAGAHQKSIGDFILKVDYIDAFGQFKTLSQSECQFAYRQSIFQKKKKWIIVGALLQLYKIDVDQKREEITYWLKYRTQAQPNNKKNCGSVFKNPEGKKAYQLIENCQLKGKRINDAMISLQHANFIENVGVATEKDILQLIDLIQKEVYKKYQILLELELEII